MTPRIYVGDDVAALTPGAEYSLPPPAARHVAQVLRLRAGETLALFTGRGGEYVADLVRVGRGEVLARVERHDAIERESPLPVTLAQSLIAADMMDVAVRKAVELGVAAIVPLQSARSQGLPRERARRRVEHWRQVAIAACEQCGRNRVPPIGELVSFADWIASSAMEEGTAMLDAAASQSLASLAYAHPPRIVLVGPEGGFTQEERERAQARGAVPAHLGPRVLRAETAAIAALVTIGALAGDAG
ncbi:MAG: 16S rRNA (uracil(1498)-N(3))-methyltransferase [Rudaea sp.]